MVAIPKSRRGDPSSIRLPASLPYMAGVIATLVFSARVSAFAANGCASCRRNSVLSPPTSLPLSSFPLRGFHSTSTLSRTSLFGSSDGSDEVSEDSDELSEESVIEETVTEETVNEETVTEDSVTEETVNEETVTEDSVSSKGGGDPLRASTGVRPSLHPIVINCITDALLIRSQSKNIASPNLPPMDASDPDTTAIDVAMAAASLAYAALEKRKKSCEADGDEVGSYTESEAQTIGGRVVGVVMRMRELEVMLAEKAKGVAWVTKYGEEVSFGLSPEEVAAAEEGAVEDSLFRRIEEDPLLRMNRAECLLALFLNSVEAPKMELIGEELPGGSVVDFIDADRLEVLIEQ